MMKFDLHVHSCRSIDSRADFVDIYSAAKRRGLAGLAICDHNHFSPPPPCDGLLIIPACEYSTTAGHLLTFFLRSPLENIIPKNDDGLFPWREIVDAAHAQNALV
ncbi:MAG: PHP domain-containing protein, partial [Clostridia bacterium]